RDGITGTAPALPGEGTAPGAEPWAVRPIARCTSGLAPVTPLTSFMGRPLKFPTHTATVNPPVVPTAQLSVKCRLVPVFTATGNGKSNGVLSPNPGMRATGSLRTSSTIAAARGETTRRSV